MISQLHTGLLLIALTVAPARGIAADPTSFGIRIYDRAEYRGALSVSINGEPGCRIELKGSDSWNESCRVPLSSVPREFTIAGELTIEDREKGREQVKGAQRLNVIDLAPLTSPLRDGGVAASERLRRFAAAKSAFEQKHPALAESTFQFELRDPVAEKETRAAEKRLGFTLPKEHRDALMGTGGFNLEDSGTESPDTFGIFLERLATEWDTPKKTIDGLSASTKEIYGSSVKLYTEVGDGLGALLYRPTGEKRCAGGPAYYWMHQDTLNKPQLDLLPNGKCARYEDALLHLIASQGFIQYEDASPGIVLLDTSSAQSMTLQLEHGWYDTGFTFRLTPEWDSLR